LRIVHAEPASIERPEYREQRASAVPGAAELAQPALAAQAQASVEPRRPEVLAAEPSRRRLGPRVLPQPELREPPLRPEPSRPVSRRRQSQASGEKQGLRQPERQQREPEVVLGLPEQQLPP